MRYSIVIPLYNKGPYVKKALESVLGQSFRDFELIVVDDGSADDSYDVAQTLLESSTVKYQLLRQVNSGVSTARNNGVAASCGDYICYLDADDWWENRFLEKLDQFIRVYPEAGVYGTNYYYVKNGRARIGVDSIKTGYINFCQAYAQKLQMPLWTGAACVPRDVFDEMGGFRSHLKLGEDFDLWIRIALKFKVAFLNEPLAFYNQDSSPEWRATAHLTEPRYHMLWNLDYLSDVERIDPDYKKLIDGLRTYSLLPYYLSQQYHDAARKELDKVDWKKQPRSTRFLYNQPLSILKCRDFILKCGSYFKQWLIKHL